MLKVEHLKKQYLEVLFRDVTFLLGDNEKVGLVGLNGCGKTTLLKIIAGIERADEGKIDVVDEKIGYLPQEFSFETDLLVGEFLEGLIENPHSEMYIIETLLSKLDFSDIDHYQYINTLSEGQKMKLMLIHILIHEPTVLLLDEPTNHLDIVGIEWFENFIKNFDGICIIISHDRMFLNNTVNRIFEIDEGKLITYEGNYDEYLVRKEEYMQQRAMEYKFQERKRRQLEDLVHRMRTQKAGRKQGRRVRAAKKRLQREVLDTEVDKYREQRIESFDIDGSIHGKKTVLELNNVTFGYDNATKIVNDCSFGIYGNQRVWFYGPNGIGKTTIIKLIIGDQKPDQGLISWGNNLNWAYFSQDQTHLDMEKTVEEFFIENTGIPYQRSFGVLEKFLFPKELRNYILRSLSPGQRARLSFAAFAQQSYDFLILDEPTNHLDIKSKEVIEQALFEFDGAILVISHDRYFVESIGIQRQITLKNGHFIEENIFSS